MTPMRLFAWLAVAALTAACTPATPEQQIVNDAADALGGSDQVMAAATLVIEGEGTQYNLGQDVVPDASGQTFAVTSYRRAIDVAGGRALTELTRQPNFNYFRGPAPRQQVQGIDGAVGYNVGGSGTANRVSEAAAATRRAQLYRHPLTAVYAALDPMATLANARTEGSESLVDVTTSGGTRFTLVTDATTGLPARVVTMSANTNLGDVAISTAFTDYQDASGVQLPTRLTTSTDDFTTEEIRVSSNMVGGDTGDLAAPESAASAPPVTGPPPVTVAEERLAPGIWHLAGGSHHSVLVEFTDNLMLIEAPQNPTRAAAVIAKARELVPDKPLTQVVNSHHHFDHSGGIRTAIAEGLTVITHDGNVGFFEEIAARSHTMPADPLASNPSPPTIEGVSAEGREITDGTMAVNLIPISTTHSETMLVAYFPRQRLLVEADVYTPGSAAQSFAGELLEILRERNLQINRIVPLHGMVVPFAQLVKEATAASTATN